MMNAILEIPTTRQSVLRAIFDGACSSYTQRKFNPEADSMPVKDAIRKIVAALGSLALGARIVQFSSWHDEVSTKFQNASRRYTAPDSGKSPVSSAEKNRPDMSSQSLRRPLFHSGQIMFRVLAIDFVIELRMPFNERMEKLMVYQTADVNAQWTQQADGRWNPYIPVEDNPIDARYVKDGDTIRVSFRTMRDHPGSSRN